MFLLEKHVTPTLPFLLLTVVAEGRPMAIEYLRVKFIISAFTFFCHSQTIHRLNPLPYESRLSHLHRAGLCHRLYRLSTGYEPKFVVCDSPRIRAK
jgi:hypothetical protein